MKQIILALLMVMLPLCGFAQEAVTQDTLAVQDSVYIVNTNTATKYHKTKTCSVVKNDLDKLKYVSLEYAKSLGRTPCKKCYAQILAETTIVYVCTGGNSKKYHLSKDCRGLSSCHGNIVKMTLLKARQSARSACNLCVK